MPVVILEAVLAEKDQVKEVGLVETQKPTPRRVGAQAVAAGGLSWRAGKRPDQVKKCKS